MRLLRHIFLALALLANAGAARAGSAGAQPFDFLFLDAHPRPVAMGGAYTALAEDANALHYNPAGLAGVRRHEATFMHNKYFQGISQEYIGYASPRGWGASLNMLRAGDIGRTTIANPDGDGLGDAAFSDLAASFGYARKVHDGISAGVGMKILRETIDDVSVTAYAFDFGAMYKAPNLAGLTLGLAVQNIGPSVTYHQASENLPLNVRLGGAYAFEFLGHRHTAALDVTKARTEDMLIAFGLESRIHRSLSARFGYNTRNDAGPGITVGFGARHRDFAFDYAFAPFGELGDAHRLGVGMKWGEGGEAAAPAGPYGRKADVKLISNTVRGYFSNTDDFILLGIYDSAKQQLELARAILPKGDHRLSLYHERMGRILELEGDCVKAQAQYTESLRLSIPRGISANYVAEAYFGMGRCLKAIGNRDYAIKFLKKALTAQPTPVTRQAVLNELRSLKALPK